MNRNRRADWRRIKSKCSYTIEEAARTLGQHRNTIRYWIRNGGLPAMKLLRPHLILGADLIAFLKARRQASKRACGPGELFCLRCRLPRKPFAELIELKAVAGRAQIVGICTHCESLMRRFVSSQKLDVTLHEFSYQFGADHGSLTDTGSPSVDCHLAASEAA